MLTPLSNDEELRSCERKVVSLIENSDLLRAESLVQEAIRQSATNQLKIVREICADLLEANKWLEQRTGHRASRAILSLVNRDLVEKLEVERKFYAAFTRDENAAPSLEMKRPVFVTGLEALMAVQRMSWPRHPAEVLHQFKTDELLCGLLLVIK